jgi:hypothetical protein
MANKPNNPSLWSRAKSLARQKFDVYPSAYANGWAAKYYKSKGGTWRKAELGAYLKNGGKFPDLTGDGQVTRADVLKGRGVFKAGGRLMQSYMAKGGKVSGIPERYKNKGFTKVGVKRQSTSPGKKWMVLAKKGDQYKVVHGGYKGMKDFTQHRNENRRDRFWNRMGGKNSAKAKDPFSPLYWHKRFGTW